MISSKNINWNLKDAILIIAIMLLLSLLIKTCNSNYELNNEIVDLNKEIDQYSYLNSNYIKTIYQDSIVIHSQKINLINEKKAKEIINRDYMLLKKTNNKNVDRLIDLQTKILVGLSIDLKDSVIKDTNGYKLKLPKYFNKSDKYYSINGVINRLGYLQIDSLSINSNIILFESDTIKKGIFNKLFNNKTRVLRVQSDNPYLVITGLNNFSIKEDPHFKRKWVKWGLYGIACAYIGYSIKH